MKQVNFRIPLRILAVLMGLFLSIGASAQITVQGHVKDATGEPVIGATIRVVGTSTAAATDFDGNFVLTANNGAQLQVTSIGYQPQTVSAAPNVVITLLEDSELLEEVVVIGYGQVKKTDATGAVFSMKPDEMNHGLQTNAQDMISGKIAGVNVTTDGGPAGSSTIRIRGGSSLNASNDPLYVIDGVPMDTYGAKGLGNALSLVNPNDIESFTVLKSASATAIYGSRASNGVVIITTKKGKAGVAPHVSYNGNVSVAVRKSTPDMLDGPSYVKFIRNLYGEDSDAYRALGWYDNAGVQHFADTNWYDEIFRTAVSTDHNITIAGSSAHMPYRFSIGYTNNQGIVKESNFKRYTASFNLSPSLLKDHLKLNLNGKAMLATNNWTGNNSGAVGQARNFDPTKPVTANSDIYRDYFGGYVQWYQGNAKFDGDPGWLYQNNSNATTNPVSSLNLVYDRSTSTKYIGNIEADYRIHGFEDLRLHVNAGGSYSNGKQMRNASGYYPGNYYYGNENWSKEENYMLSLSAYAQYLKELKDHTIDIMAGYEYQKFHQYSNWYGYGRYPDHNTLHAGEIYNPPTTETRYKTGNVIVSFFGRLNYSYKDRYLFTFTLRDDGSSRFHKDHRWGLFPSAAFAWRIKEEAFLKDVQAINDLKLRLDYGITGQQEGIGNYTYIPTYTPSRNHAFYDIGLINGLLYRPDAYNPNLTWEKTTTYNAGLDMALWNNRWTFSVDYYYRKTKDLLNNVYTPAGTNFSNVVQSNVGSLHNTGVEFATTVRPIVKKDFTWEISYNMTYNRNRIDELITGEGEDYNIPHGGAAGGVGGNVKAHHVGNAVGAFWVYQQVYDANGKIVPNTYVDRDGNGMINDKDRYYYYKPTPDVTMGLSSKFLYKNWDLGFSARASLGNYMYNGVEAGSANVGRGAVYVNAFASNRPITAVERGLTTMLTEQFISDCWIENASFLKLDNITLGYSFPRLFGYDINGRIYATVQNVWTWTKYSGIDPEVNGGYDGDIYPRALTSILGLTLNF